MHIAILDADIPVPKVYTSRGLYSTQFRHLLQAAASRLQHSSSPSLLPITTSSYDIVGGVLPPLGKLRTAGKNEDKDAIDGILITGSSNSACDKHAKPWIARLEDFIRTIFAGFPGVKVFGSCFGHQIIAQALLSLPSACGGGDGENGGGGFRVEHCPYGYEVGIVPITLDGRFNNAFPYIAEKLGGRELRLQLVHGDRVVPDLSPTATADSDPKPEIALPAPWLNLGYTAKCPIQGLYHPGRVLTFQGHFEFDSFVNRETCVEFGRRFGWKEAEIGEFVKRIDVAAGSFGEGEGEGGDGDDSRVAAEAVVLFFAS